MKNLKIVLLSLLAISVLSGCNGGFAGKALVHRPESLVLPPSPQDSALSCLPIEVFSVIITRDSALSGRVTTLEGQIDAHNK